jgi:hypothetical protein
VRRFTGKLDINKGMQTFSAATLTSGESKYLVSGAISPSRVLKLELIRANAGKRWDSTSAARNRQGRYIITGSVDRPVVSALGAELPISPGASSGNRAGASIPSGPPR